MKKASLKAGLALVAVSALLAADIISAQVLPALNASLTSTVDGATKTITTVVATTTTAVSTTVSREAESLRTSEPTYVPTTTGTVQPVSSSGSGSESDSSGSGSGSSGSGSSTTTKYVERELVNTQAEEEARRIEEAKRIEEARPIEEAKRLEAQRTEAARKLEEARRLEAAKAAASVSGKQAEEALRVPLASTTVKSVPVTSLPFNLPETRPIAVPATTTASTSAEGSRPAEDRPRAEEPRRADDPRQNSGSGSLTSGSSNASGTAATTSPSEGPRRDAPTVASVPPAEVARKIGEVAATVTEATKTAVENRERLKAEVDKHIEDLIAKSAPGATSTAALAEIQAKLETEIERSFKEGAAVDPSVAEKLGPKIAEGLREAQRLAPTAAFGDDAVTRADEAVRELVAEAGDRAEALQKAGADKLFKDSNGDGVSDYDSVHVFGIDPEKPTPVSVYEGRQLRAEEKILLGFDPTKEELVKIAYEEPRAALAPIVETHAVTEVALADEGKVALKGKALPNSFVTIYVYSTPVIVTVKADESGEWSYVLDRELEDGGHSVYVATVSNSGKIVARSQGFAFTKTAEAATLEDSPFAAVADERPSLWNGRTIAALAILFVVMSVTALVLIGRGGGGEQNPPMAGPSTPAGA